MIKLTQAVILCGGQGTRLLPYTLNKPKIMVSCNENPFLFYIIDQLINQGIKNLILCTGYKYKNIDEYLKKKNFDNIKIETAYSNTNTKTGTRLKKIENKLNDHFLLLYSDNYTNFILKNRVKNFKKNQSLLELTIVKKKNGNISFNKSKNVIYSKTRSEKFNFVEVSYAICSKKILDFYNKNNPDFKNIIYKIGNIEKLTATINNNYQSISDPKRLKVTQKFFTQKKIIFIDRDGIINRKPQKGNYVTKLSELFFLESNLSFLRLLSNKGFKFIIVTNQAGINRGFIKKNNYEKINKKIKEKFKNDKIKLLNIYTCPHHWIENCECRKPKGGLFIKIEKKYNLKLDQYIFIGDSISDMETTKETLCKGILISKKLQVKSKVIKSFKNIFRAKQYIFDFYNII